MSNLLREAIAEAKQVKAAAQATAKAMLEATYAPTIQRIVSAKLAEEEEMDDDEMEQEPEMPAPDEGETDDSGFGDIEGEFETEEDDVELESLIRELEGEDEMMEMDDEEMTMEMDDMELEEGDEEDWSDPIAEMDEEDIYEMIVREMEGEDDEMMAESEDGGAYTETPPNRQNNTESRRIRNENKQLKRKLNEALSVVTTLKKTINEVNLLNAKLMYNTHVNKTYDLNKSQKNFVLEALDRANSVRDVKLVYTTICESLNKTTQLRKSKISEGYASKSTPAVNQKKYDYDFVPRWKELANIKK